MSNYNKVTLMGNLTREWELRYTPKGTAVAENSIAVNETRTDDSGQKIESTTFLELTAWGRNAENLHKYTTKGQPLFVEGKLKQETWQDKATGGTRSKIKVVVQLFQFIGTRQQSGTGDPAPRAAESGGQAPQPGPATQQGNNPYQQPSPGSGVKTKDVQGWQGNANVEETDDIPF